MKPLKILVLIFLFFGCQPNRNEKVLHENEDSKSNISAVVDKNVELDNKNYSDSNECECAKSQYSNQTKPDTGFNFSNNKKLLVCGYSEIKNEKRIFSEFTLTECKSDTILGFWGAVENCELEFENDTFKIKTLELFATGKNYEYQRLPWLTENFYYLKDILQREKNFNSKIIFGKKEILETLEDYEQVDWKTQENAASHVFSEGKMKLANRLMISAISGSEIAEKYFNEFKEKFKPDGAYAEWYSDMKAMLKYSKSK